MGLLDSSEKVREQSLPQDKIWSWKVWVSGSLPGASVGRSRPDVTQLSLCLRAVALRSSHGFPVVLWVLMPVHVLVLGVMSGFWVLPWTFLILCCELSIVFHPVFSF